MKRFEFLEHIADLKIRAFGKTKEELFLNMLAGMAESQKAELLEKKEIRRKIHIESLDFRALLVDFLNEALYSSQTNKEVYSKAEFTEFTDKKIEGKLIGQKVKRFGEDIKAVTYHNLEIKQRAEGIWEATVLFDI
jgi:SHS2 domain-containing protein